MKRILAILFLVILVLTPKAFGAANTKSIDNDNDEGEDEADVIVTTGTPNPKIDIENNLLKAVFDVIQLSPKEDQVKAEKKLKDLLKKVHDLISHSEGDEEEESTSSKDKGTNGGDNEDDLSSTDENDLETNEADGTKGSVAPTPKKTGGQGKSDSDKSEKSEERSGDQGDDEETVEETNKIGPKGKKKTNKDKPTDASDESVDDEQESVEKSKGENNLVSKDEDYDLPDDTGEGKSSTSPQKTNKEIDEDEDKKSASGKMDKKGKSKGGNSKGKSDDRDNEKSTKDGSSGKSKESHSGKDSYDSYDYENDQNEGKEELMGKEDWKKPIKSGQVTTLEDSDLDTDRTTGNVPTEITHPKKGQKHFYHSTPFLFFLFCSIIAMFSVYFGYVSRRKIKAYFYRNLSNGRRMKESKRSLEDAMPSFGNVKS